MIKKSLIFFGGILLATLLLTNTAFAEILLFTGESCSHCQRLEDHLNENDLYQKLDIQQFEIYNSKENRDLYLAKAVELEYRNGGVPWMVNGSEHIEGATPIIEYLANLQSPNENTLAEESPAVEKTTLNKTESGMLNQMIKAQIKKDKQNPQSQNNSSNDDGKSFKSIWISMGIGVLLFAGIAWKMRR